MTVEEVQSVVKGITYKPNCRMRVEPYGDKRYTSIVTIYIESKVLDSVHGKAEVTIIFQDRFDIRWFETASDVIRWVGDCLMRWEKHELDEWFRFNGNLVHDPHGSDMVAKR